jgi:16S rRNA (adenine1518-N6/adenine1519-N6)-dimethyltransferase
MRVKEKLSGLGVKPSKGRGQNFTIDPEVISRILEFSPVLEALPIIEIGPGLGALTAELLKAGHVTAIEIEKALVPELEAKYSNLTVLNHDIREFNLSTLGEKIQVYGNLPYSISTEIVMHTLKYGSIVQRATYLLQREFVERLGAKPGGRDYGSLSIAVQLHADVELGPKVAGNSFHPPTKVESQVVRIVPLKKPRVELKDPKFFELVVRTAFRQRRKQLPNCLKALPNIDADDIRTALTQSDIDPQRRPETLSIEEFARLTTTLMSQAKRLM